MIGNKRLMPDDFPKLDQDFEEPPLNPEDPEPDTEIGKALDAANAIRSALQEGELAKDQLNNDRKSGLSTELRWNKDLEKSIESLSNDDKLYVMVGDLNNFKAVNDALGHDKGDVLLGIIGGAIKSTFRRQTDSLARGDRELRPHTATSDSTEEKPSIDSLARLGGDEFAILSVIKNDEDAQANRGAEADIDTIIANHAKRLNDKIAELLKGTEFEQFNVSMALGGAQYDPTLDVIPRDVYIRADVAMFEVKYREKIDKLTDEDRKKLIEIIPYIESLGARVDSWLKEAVFSSNNENNN